MGAFWMALLSGFICLNPVGVQTIEKNEAAFFEKVRRSALGVAALKRNDRDMKVGCYRDKSSGRFFLIRNKRVVEVSEMTCFEGFEVYVPSIDFVDSTPVLYKELLLVADVFSKSFPDRKSAEDFLEKLEDSPDGETLFWINHCLLDLEDDDSK